MEQIHRLAARQWGVLNRHAILNAGFSPGQLERMVEGGVLRRVGFRTYLFAGSASTWHQAVAIAVTAAGERSAASHRTAAFLLGLTDRRPPAIEVVTPRWRRSRAVDFVVHESLDLADDDITRVR